jgi:hypothetical protein
MCDFFVLCTAMHLSYRYRKWLIIEHWDCVRITSIGHAESTCKIEVAGILSKYVQYSENEDGSLTLVMGTPTIRDQQMWLFFNAMEPQVQCAGPDRSAQLQLRVAHVVFRASDGGKGPQLYWNVGQMRWSIEKNDNEARLVFLCSCRSLIFAAVHRLC